MAGPDDAFLAPDDALRGFDDDDSDVESGTGGAERPGAVLADGEVAGTWRPRKTGSSLVVAVELWTAVPREAVTEAAERLAAFRGVLLKDVHID